MEWISVKEKLPESMKYVLITDGWYSDVAFYWEIAGRWELGEDYFTKDEITHWLEYPDLPPEGRKPYEGPTLSVRENRTTD